MKQIFLTLLTVLLSIHALKAQTINGKVVDSKNQPIGFANVALCSLPDSTLVTGTITNENGEYSIDTKNANNAFLKISFVGYQTQTVNPVSVQTITLKDDNQLLGEVVVKGSIPKI